MKFDQYLCSLLSYRRFPLRFPFRRKGLESIDLFNQQVSNPCATYTTNVSKCFTVTQWDDVFRRVHFDVPNALKHLDRASKMQYSVSRVAYPITITLHLGRMVVEQWVRGREFWSISNKSYFLIDSSWDTLGFWGPSRLNQTLNSGRIGGRTFGHIGVWIEHFKSCPLNGFKNMEFSTF